MNLCKFDASPARGPGRAGSRVFTGKIAGPGGATVPGRASAVVPAGHFDAAVAPPGATAAAVNVFRQPLSQPEKPNTNYYE